MDNRNSRKTMQDQSPSAAVILVNWNSWRESIACIESCLALNWPGLRILLCDNASPDGSAAHILSWARGELTVERDPLSPVVIDTPRLPRGVAQLDRHAAESGDDGHGAELLVIQTGANLGFAGGNNIGLRWVLKRGVQYAWLLNNDTVASSESLSNLIACFQAEPTAGLCGSVLAFYSEPTKIQAISGAMSTKSLISRHIGAGENVCSASEIGARQTADNHEIIYPVGASILVSSEFLGRVGLMNEDYFLYYEEADWVLRSLDLYRPVVAYDSVVFHRVGASAGSTPDGQSARSVGYLYRSRLLMAKRYFPHRLPSVVFGIFLEALKALVRGRTGRAVAAARALSGRVVVPSHGKLIK